MVDFPASHVRFRGKFPQAFSRFLKEHFKLSENKKSRKVIGNPIGKDREDLMNLFSLLDTPNLQDIP